MLMGIIYILIFLLFAGIIKSSYNKFQLYRIGVIGKIISSLLIFLISLEVYSFLSNTLQNILLLSLVILFLSHIIGWKDPIDKN